MPEPIRRLHMASIENIAFEKHLLHRRLLIEINKPFLFPNKILVNLFEVRSKLFSILENEFPVDSRRDAPFPNGFSFRAQKNQFAAQRGESSVKYRHIRPFHGARPDAVCEVQSIEDRETPRLRVFLNAEVQPLQYSDNPLEMPLIFGDGERAMVFSPGEWSVGVGLGQMHDAAQPARFGNHRMAAEKRVNERGLSYAGSTFDDQRVKGRHCFSKDKVVQI